MNLAINGGSPIRTHPFPVRKTMGKEEKEAVLRVMDSDVLSGFVGADCSAFYGGKEVKNLEAEWKDRFDVKHAISVSSWTAGLQVIMGAIGIEPGDEVICPPYTMSASATSALFYGGVPVFADIDKDTYNINPESIRKNISTRTKAIVVVHLFGNPANMHEIIKIGKEHNLRIIEDAAQSPGVQYKGQQVGSIADIGGFSLNYHKHIHCGEGGVIVTNDDELAKKCMLIRNHGENVVESFKFENISNLFGSNYRLTELQAGIATSQLKKLDGILEKRNRLAKHLDNRLKDIKGLNQPYLEKDNTHSYYMYPIRYEEEVIGISRSTFRMAVMAELPRPTSWDTTPLAEGYVKPLYFSKLYQDQIALGSKGFPFNVNKEIVYNYQEGLCPIAENMYSKELLVSPLIQEAMEIKDIDSFADALAKVVKNKHELFELDENSSDSVFDPVEALDSCA